LSIQDFYYWQYWLWQWQRRQPRSNCLFPFGTVQ